ncbi:hypothetical protein KM176_02635 [Pseudooceanicola sp. CBS1P-1]|uniref:Uncharacterized protein n=1 Tax=Pseudooceanicola albus TaxID=2692189 RepID=A0A6L7FZR0_9RHOB|nr:MULTISPECIES: hypothetical protein [Pseudooceanicola]MBT9382747.1 hypothetical protein [Pseudooceanicola endophyticus]MXN17285.1 hypothetical protein [Pseudooceanicola albus]
MALFEGTRGFLSAILKEATFTDDELWEFTDVCQRARFLLSADTAKYLQVIRTRSLIMRTKQVQFKKLPVGPERSKLVDEEGAELKWLTDQLPLIFDVFTPYLKFDELIERSLWARVRSRRSKKFPK